MSAKKTLKKLAAKKSVVKKGEGKVRARKVAGTLRKEAVVLSIKSPIIREILAQAGPILKDPDLLNRFVASAGKKVGTVDVAAFKENFMYLKAMIRLLGAYYRGDYREVPWKSLVMIAAAVIYFVCPLDVIPDGILGVGYIDDSIVLTFALDTVKSDLDAFTAWEDAHRS